MQPQEKLTFIIWKDSVVRYGEEIIAFQTKTSFYIHEGDMTRGTVC